MCVIILCMEGECVFYCKFGRCQVFIGVVVVVVGCFLKDGVICFVVGYVDIIFKRLLDSEVKWMISGWDLYELYKMFIYELLFFEDVFMLVVYRKKVVVNIIMVELMVEGGE